MRAAVSGTGPSRELKRTVMRQIALTAQARATDADEPRQRHPFASLVLVGSMAFAVVMAGVVIVTLVNRA